MQALLFVRECDHDKTNIYNDTGENFTENLPVALPKESFPFKVGNNDSESHLPRVALLEELSIRAKYNQSR